MPRSDPRFEVPPEYADVYERAFRSASGRGDEEESDAGAERRPPGGRRRLTRAALVVLLVLVVAVVAFVVGRESAGRDTGARTTPSPGSTPSRTAAPRTTPVGPTGASSTCAPPTVSGADSETVSFAPENTLDDVRATGWACAGVAVGQELVLRLPAGRTVTSVGLLPITDVSGVMVNRLRAVDWMFDDGSTYRQDLVAGAVAQIRSVPTTRARTVRVRLASVSPGPADLTGISSVYLFGPAQ